MQYLMSTELIEVLDCFGNYFPEQANDNSASLLSTDGDVKVTLIRYFWKFISKCAGK